MPQGVPSDTPREYDPVHGPEGQRTAVQHVMASRHASLIAFARTPVIKPGFEIVSGAIHTDNEPYKLIFALQDKMTEVGTIKFGKNQRLLSLDPRFRCHVILRSIIPSDNMW